MSTSRIFKVTSKNIKVSGRPKTANMALVKRESPKIPILLLGTLDRIEDVETSQLKSLSLLEIPSSLSTPRSIHKFVDNLSITAVHQSSARIIQKCWKRYLSKKRMRHFLEFISRLRARRLKYSMSLWKLTLNPPADQAITPYKEITNHLLFTGMISPLSKDPWIIATTNMRFVPFNIYMKTNFIFFNPKVDQEKIIDLIKIFFRSTLKQMFSAWYTIASERFILARAARKVTVLSNYRNIFGPQFWTFHVWRRWAQYKEKKRFDLIESKSQFYIPEWAFFKAKKLTMIRMRRESTEMYQKNLIQRAIRSLHNRSVTGNAREASYRDIVKYLNRGTMMKAYRALITQVSFKKMQDGRIKRAFRSWYTVIDQLRIRKMNYEIMKKRKGLTLMQSYFRSWRTNILEEGSSILLQHSKIMENQSKVMRILYLMIGDKTHYLFVSAFRLWRNYIKNKKFTHSFVSWSLNKSKQMTLMRFIYDCFKINAEHTVNRLNYLPFRVEGEKNNISISDTNSIKIGNQKRKLSKAVKQTTQGASNIQVYTNSVSDVVIGYTTCMNNEAVDDKWLSRATSDEISKLLYQIIVLKIYNQKKNTEAELPRTEELRRFRLKFMLFNQAGVSELKQRNLKSDQSQRRIMIKRHQRDNDLLISMAAHDAAISLSSILSSFTVNSSPKFMTEANTIVETYNDFAIDLPPSPGLPKNNQRQRRHSIRPKTQVPTHPLLQPIEKIKSEALKNARKYRRQPDEIFSRIEHKKQRIARTTLEHFNVGSKLAQQTSIYESFIPAVSSQRLAQARSNHEFDIREAGKIAMGSLNHATNNIPLDTDYSQIETKISVEKIPTIKEQSSDSSLATGKVSAPTSLHKFPSLAKVGIVPEELSSSDGEDTFSSTEKQHSEPLLDLSRPLTCSQSRFVEVSNHVASNISLEALSSSFLDDEFNRGVGPEGRVNHMMGKYFQILDIVLSANSNKSKKPDLRTSVSQMNLDFPSLHSRIFKILRKILPEKAPPQISKEMPPSDGEAALKKRIDHKKSRKKLFNDPDKEFEKVKNDNGEEFQKSTCPEFSNVLFQGQTVLTSSPWSVKRPKKPKIDPSLHVQTLPTAQINVQGFESLPALQQLEKDVTTFLGISTKDISNTPRKEQHNRAILEIMDSVAHMVVNLEADRKGIDEITKLVESEENEEIKTPEVLNENPKEKDSLNQTTNTPKKSKYSAFPTDRKKEKIHYRYKERYTFTKDLLEAISEGSKLTKPILVKYYSSVEEINPFEGMEKLRSYLKNVAKTVNEKKEELSAMEEPPFPAEPATPLNIGGVSKRQTPFKSKSTVKTPRTKSRNEPENPDELIISPSLKRPHTANPSVRNTNLAKKPKPHITKMAPSFPKQDDQLVMDTQTQFRPHTSMSEHKKFKWIIPKYSHITDTDIDLFLYITPFLLPPELLNDLIEKLE